MASRDIFQLGHISWPSWGHDFHVFVQSLLFINQAYSSYTPWWRGNPICLANRYPCCIHIISDSVDSACCWLRITSSVVAASYQTDYISVNRELDEARVLPREILFLKSAIRSGYLVLNWNIRGCWFGGGGGGVVHGWIHDVEWNIPSYLL